MRRLAEQHDPRVADALEQRAEVASVDRRRSARRPRARGERAVAGRLGACAGRPFHAVGSAAQPWAPMSGTKRTSPSSSRAKSAIGSAGHPDELLRRCGPRPTGMTRRPPAASCSSSASGTFGPPAATTIASYGACSGQPSVPSPWQHRDVREAELRQAARPRRVGQLLVPLDGVDLARDPAEDRRGVARAGADLEHAIAGPERERRGHQRDDVRLRDRLPALDRQRRVLVGELRELGGEERLARTSRIAASTAGSRTPRAAMCVRTMCARASDRSLISLRLHRAASTRGPAMPGPGDRPRWPAAAPHGEPAADDRPP